MIWNKTVFEIGTAEWEGVTLEAPDGISVVGAIARAIREMPPGSCMSVSTKGGQCYLVSADEIELMPGTLLLDIGTGSRLSQGENGIPFEQYKVLIPFSAIDGIAFE